MASLSDIGSYWVYIQVSDGNSTDSTNFTLTVIKYYVPQITTINVLTAYVGELYSVNYTATDLDTTQNQLTWSMSSNASWLSFSSTQDLSGTPSSTDIGTYWVNITVYDNHSSDSTNFTLTVMKRYVPPPPPPPNPNGSVIILRTGQRFMKIQDAIDNARSGDTIRVYSGIFYENIMVNKTLYLIGNGSSKSVIDGSNKDTVVKINANWCRITGFGITGSHLKSDYYTSSGILIIKNNNNTIQDCTIYSNGWGINLVSAERNNIQYCTIVSNKYNGINMSGSDYNLITNCNISNNGGGLSLASSDGNFIDHCLINLNSHTGISISDSVWNIISNNTMFRNNDFGVIINNGKYNIIYNNNFLSNNIQARDDSLINSWEMGKRGNYWSNWNSPDKDNDGIVDNPYNISGGAGAKDYYPLVNMVGSPAVPKINAPNIVTANLKNAYVGVQYSVNYSATDLDTPPNLLTWSMFTNASWLTFSSSQRLYGTPAKSDIGTYWVYIEVTDGYDNDFTNFTLSVKERESQLPNHTIPKIERSNLINNSNNVSVDNTAIIITFSKPMNRTSVESALSISPQTNYSISWDENNTEMKITFTETLIYNTTYEIIIDRNAKDINGNYLEEPLELVFTTVIESELDDGGDGEETDEDDFLFENGGVLGIIVILIILIIVIITFAFVYTNFKKKKITGAIEVAEVEERQEVAGQIADEFQFPKDFQHDSDEFIEELKEKALELKKPSHFDLNEPEMLNKIESKYRNGEISRETYIIIKEILIKNKE